MCIFNCLCQCHRSCLELEVGDFYYSIFFSSATGDIYACFYKMCCPNEEAGASQAIEIKLRRYASGTFLYHRREADEHAL